MSFFVLSLETRECSQSRRREKETKLFQSGLKVFSSMLKTRLKTVVAFYQRPGNNLGHKFLGHLMLYNPLFTVLWKETLLTFSMNAQSYWAINIDMGERGCIMGWCHHLFGWGCIHCRNVLDVIVQKRVRVFYRGFQTREN